MEKKIFTNKTAVVILALFCAFLWGSATPTIKIGYKLFNISPSDTMSIILFAGSRFFLAGIMTIILGSIINKKFLVPKKSSWGMVITLSFVQTVFLYVFSYIGVANTTGAKSPIISGANSFFSVLLSSLVFKMEKLTPGKIIGCIIGFIGILVLNLTKDFELSFTLTGEGFLVISIIFYALASVLTKKYSEKENPVTLCGWQFTIGGLIMIIFAFICGGKVHTGGLLAYLSLFYLAFVASVAFTVWGLLLKYNPVSKITAFSLGIPVFGVILSVLLLDEPVNLVQYTIALALVCLGIYIVNVNREPAKKNIS